MTYDAKDITVLEGLEPVRKRPGMYIGGVGSTGLHHLVWEIVDNSVDEAINGFATEITVVLHADGESVTVTDNGRGIPVDPHPKYKRSALELIFSTLHAGGKFEKTSYKTAGGLHGVGASVVNALSSELVATVKRAGATWQITFRGGSPVSKLRKLGAARGTGCQVFFRPDPTVFPKTTFNADSIRERLEVTSYLHKGLKVTFTVEATSSTVVFQHNEGIGDFLRTILQQREARVVHEVPFTLSRDNGVRVELVMQWTESTDTSEAT